MTQAEQTIMQYFRRYRIDTGEMLFFNTAPTSTSAHFRGAMDSLIRRGLVVKERPKHAYSLTEQGFAASQLA